MYKIKTKGFWVSRRFIIIKERERLKVIGGDGIRE